MSIQSDIRKAKAAIDRTPEHMHVQANVSDEGVLSHAFRISLSEWKLKRGRRQNYVVYLAQDKEPVTNEDGILAFEHDVYVDKEFEGDEDAFDMLVNKFLPDLSGQSVDLVFCAKKSKFPIVIILLLLLLAGLGVYFYLNWGDPRAKKGYYDGKSKEEIQADLDTEMNWYEMEISIASLINMKEGSTKCELRLENVEANHCDQKVTLALKDDPSDILFTSGAIAPGEYIQEADLTHTLPVGSHQVIATFQGYEQTPQLLSEEGVLFGHNPFGASCGAEITIRVIPSDVELAEKPENEGDKGADESKEGSDKDAAGQGAESEAADKDEASQK